MASLIEQVEQQIAEMTPEQIEAELKKALEAANQRKAKQAEYNEKPEVKEKRAAYSKAYQDRIKADPEKAEAQITKRKEYNQRPDVKAKRADYMKARNAKVKALLAAAKAQGLDVDAIQASVAGSQQQG